MKIPLSLGKASFDKDPVDKKVSLSMMMALGMVMASGALAEAKAKRERQQRRLNTAGFGETNAKPSSTAVNLL